MYPSCSFNQTGKISEECLIVYLCLSHYKHHKKYSMARNTPKQIKFATVEVILGKKIRYIWREKSAELGDKYDLNYRYNKLIDLVNLKYVGGTFERHLINKFCSKIWFSKLRLKSFETIWGYTKRAFLCSVESSPVGTKISCNFLSYCKNIENVGKYHKVFL
jgi:hypothetical protein